ncbi:hypothetical protein Tsubulata_041333 [Turnera subulata]|uniref:Polysaccharide biosynthesis domain-containing protein n=1 Tax=Turnera subulata TaxID=218843 RepID=A0A9Q0F521_9ROSI|nr:hypothetical protein Tsubulata_041333 [Turnera subulata]
MPPEVPYFRPLTTPLIRISPPSSPETQPSQPISRKLFKGSKGIMFPVRKILPLLVFILSSFSIFRLLRVAITASSSTPPQPALSSKLKPVCAPQSPECNKVRSNLPGSPTTETKPSLNSTYLTRKEFKLLATLIKHKAPCNLLVFGLEAQYLKLSSINSGGITIFLEDDLVKISAVQAKYNTSRIYKVDYQAPSKKAYNLLKYARKSPACAPRLRKLQRSKCKLALRDLPEEVYDLKWDVVVVDGPSGHSPEAPGRMAVIYTAAIIARSAGKSTDVVVHDVDRTIEKWFSWEFLCEENLVSSKGKLWNFRITGGSYNSTKFC